MDFLKSERYLMEFVQNIEYFLHFKGHNSSVITSIFVGQGGLFYSGATEGQEEESVWIAGH